MTDRINGFWVALDADIRDDDVEPLINAILQLRGVIKVKGHVTTSTDWLARARVRQELTAKLFDALKDDK